MPVFKVISGCRSVRDRTVRLYTHADFLHDEVIRAQQRKYFEEDGVAGRRGEIRKVEKKTMFERMTSTGSSGEGK